MPLPEAEERTIPRAEQNSHFGLHDSQIYVKQSKSSMMDRLTDHGEIYQHPEEYHEGGNKGILKCPFL